MVKVRAVRAVKAEQGPEGPPEGKALKDCNFFE